MATSVKEITRTMRERVMLREDRVDFVGCGAFPLPPPAHAACGTSP
jgi:hypothetical protein